MFFAGGSLPILRLMIWFGIDCNPQVFWVVLFFYFIILLFFPVYRRYFFAKNIIIVCSVSLFLILLLYLQFYSYVVDRDLSLIVLPLDFLSAFSLPELSISLELNALTYLFSLLVFAIGFFTNIYSLNYFKFEADDLGFIFWLNAFVASMGLLVLSGNLFTLFLGWELIGLTSFFLINFWGVRRATLKSSFKAFSFNLLSDLFLLAALVILYGVYQTGVIGELEGLVQLGRSGQELQSGLPAYLLVACASIKSVQLVGHLWLPDSMEAPVPASSLIHSATLVSAGVFLLMRFNFILAEANMLGVVALLGSVTAAYGAIVSASQTDVKKLLAYSTMSHCGFLFVIVGVGDARAAIAYLFLHGLFKAGTFFCVGSLIRLFGTQDTRLMGGCARLYWGDSALLLLCSINLCGLPLTVGSAYKACFLKLLLSSAFGFFSLGMVLVAMLFSVLYFYRLTFYSLFDAWKHLWGRAPTYLELLVPYGKPDPRERIFMEYYTVGRFTTFSHWTATTLLLLFSFWVYKSVLFNFQVTAADSSLWGLHQPTSNFILDCGMYFYRYYVLYFYSLYVFLLTILIFITWRSQASYSTKAVAALYTLLATLGCYFLVCEAQF